MDNSEEIKGEEEAKKVLIGEWDWNTTGYFVFTKDKVYLYESSKKSMDNVYYGTYTADNKIATYASGYVDGIHIIMTAEKYYLDGKEQTITNNQLEFTFTKNSDGTYTVKNLTAGISGKATKIK